MISLKVNVLMKMKLNVIYAKIRNIYMMIIFTFVLAKKIYANYV